MTLQYWANIAEIAGGVTIVGGVIFGLVQLRELRNQRRDATAAELMRTFYSTDLSRAVLLIQSLPESVSAKELRRNGAKYERAAVLITTSFETMGLLVYQRIAPYALVEQLAGGMIACMWRKLNVWTETLREEQNQPSWAEWFQWLAEHVQNGDKEFEPAHIKYRDWRPR